MNAPKVQVSSGTGLRACVYYYSHTLSAKKAYSYGRPAGRPNIDVWIPAFAGMDFPSLCSEGIEGCRPQPEVRLRWMRFFLDY
jgi:hypothetical protein